MNAVKKVKTVMEKRVVTVGGNSDLHHVSKLLITNRLSGMPVVDSKGNLAGFISERDVIKALAGGDIADTKTKQIMTKKVISIDEDATVEDASQLFSKYPIRYIPVCRNKKVVGIVSRKSVIEKLLVQYY